MTVLTGADGDMFYGTERVGKVRNWSLSINRDAIDDTCLGDNDRTYISGLRNVTGSCSIFYDPGNKRARELMNTIFEDQAVAQDVSFVFNRKENDAFRCNVLLTNVTSSVDVGAAQAVNVTFQVSGAIEGRF